MLQKGRHKDHVKRPSYKEAKLQRFLETDVSFKKTTVIEMDPSQQQLPRLTGALRVFGGVSSRLSRESVSLDEVLLRKKQDRKKNESRETQKTWDKLTEEVVAQCSKQESAKVARVLSSVGVLSLE